MDKDRWSKFKPGTVITFELNKKETIEEQSRVFENWDFIKDGEWSFVIKDIYDKRIIFFIRKVETNTSWSARHACTEETRRINMSFLSRRLGKRMEDFKLSADEIKELEKEIENKKTSMLEIKKEVNELKPFRKEFNEIWDE